MNDDRLSDLMNRSIDDELSAEERDELESYLKIHPEQNRRFESLKAVTQALTRIPRSPAPADLKQEIMRLIRARELAKARKPGLFSGLSDFLGNRLAWRYALTFSAGALCGVIILAIALNPGNLPSIPEASQVSGTLMPMETPVDLVTVDSEMIDVDYLSGTFEVKVDDNNVYLEIDINMSRKAEMEILYDTADFSFSGIWPARDFTGSVDINKGHLTLRQPGKGKHIILFSDRTPTESDLIFEIRSGDDLRTGKLSTGPIQ